MKTRWHVVAMVAVTLIAVTGGRAAPRATVFGATWGGPCGVVKSFLTQNGDPFEWLEIDVEANRERFERVSDGINGIPPQRPIEQALPQLEADASEVALSRKCR